MDGVDMVIGAHLWSSLETGKIGDLQPVLLWLHLTHLLLRLLVREGMRDFHIKRLMLLLSGHKWLVIFSILYLGMWIH